VCANVQALPGLVNHAFKRLAVSVEMHLTSKTFKADVLQAACAQYRLYAAVSFSRFEAA
jgi:hypothetical protein